jgi:hypothetical protein
MAAINTSAFNGCHQHQRRPLALPATQNSYKRHPHPQLNPCHLSPKFFSSLPCSHELLSSAIIPLHPSIAVGSPSTFSRLAIHSCLSQSPHGERTTTRAPFQSALVSPTAVCARSHCRRPSPTHRSVPVRQNRNQGSWLEVTKGYEVWSTMDWCHPLGPPPRGLSPQSFLQKNNSPSN